MDTDENILPKNADSSVEFLKNWSNRPKTLAEATKLLTAIREYTPRVGVFGDTGVGKSSLCNALFGKDIAPVSDVEACTREAKEVPLGDGNIVLIDVPGVGEDKERHAEYIKLYAKLLQDLDLVIWAIKADDRKFMTSIDVYENLIKPSLVPIVFVITQVDKIEPYREWDQKNNKPSANQENNINRKILDISKRFDISADKIIPIAANDGYNLISLLDKIVDILPKEKRFSVVREAAAKNVSESAARYAETGVWETIKEWAGDAWEKIKPTLAPIIIETGKLILKKIPFFGKFFG